MDPNTLAVWKNIETQLRVPFRKNMADLLLEMARDQTTDPKKIASWMLTTSVCICNAIFEKEDPMPLLSIYIRALLENYPHILDDVAQIYDHVQLSRYLPVIAGADEFIGICSAAGSTFANGELILSDDEIDISPKGFERFKVIWEVPTRKLDNPEDHPDITVVG